MSDLTANQRHSIRYRDYYSVANRSYYSRNKKDILLRHKVNRDTWRSKAIEYLGGICAKCGFFDTRALQIDHVKGRNGIPRSNNPSFYQDILRNKVGDKYQLLCANCNQIKKVENNEIGYGKGRERVLYE